LRTTPNAVRHCHGRKVGIRANRCLLGLGHQGATEHEDKKQTLSHHQTKDLRTKIAKKRERLEGFKK